ncbi:MAG: hypothetical protein II937_14670 [Bacteroidales bacterium]|nr:hypothetical protein [Bacteroidales bacterium]
MERTRVYLYQTTFNTSYTDKRDSIVLPTNVKKVVGICPNLTRGTGYISVVNEKTNDILVNQARVSDDNGHWNEKNIPVLNRPEANNLFYVFRMINGEKERKNDCVLKIYVTYLEE